jgi:hypothetical protein
VLLRAAAKLGGERGRQPGGEGVLLLGRNLGQQVSLGRLLAVVPGIGGLLAVLRGGRDRVTE